MSKRRRRRRAKFVVPVASMADIAFLLIIFFMLCSTFAKEAGIVVQPPVSAGLDQVEKTSIVVTIDADNRIYYQGKSIYSADAVENEIADRLRNVASEKGKRVLFRCDRAVDRAVFEPVMDAITRAGGTIVAVGDEKKE